MLSRAVESYLTVRRAVGFKVRDTHWFLRDFVVFARARGDDHVQVETAVAWAALAPSVVARDRRLKEIIRFARYARAEDERHGVPPKHYFGTPRLMRRLPHIYTPAEVREILEHAGRLGPRGSLRPHTCQTLFGLLASCGLRVSEALALRIADVTADGLVIHETKFRKSRRVAVHDTTRQAIEDYLRRRRGVAGATDRLFVSRRGFPFRYQAAVMDFLAVLRTIGLRGPAGTSGPQPDGARLHDLRHTFAVRALEQPPSGEPSRHMLALSTYMGHASIADTYWYLHVTPQLMGTIADACREYLHGGEA